MAVDPAVIAAARAKLAQLGVTVADLQRAERPRVPTVAEYLPRVVAAAGVGSRRAYGTYWQRMAVAFVARTSGNDAILDALLLRLHTETACRRGGALGLRLADLDVQRGLVRLREKAGVMRWQPITLDLATALAEHAQHRGAVLPTDALLRFRHGQALTSRRYDHLWNRIGHELPWVATQGISTHWLRHTTLTWVERHFGYGIARAYAGHTDTTGPATATYIKVDLPAVATASLR
ncbi:MAG: integrase/recombinase XerC [Micromonosporaceae bacterium]|jgi:integrase|nr:integrase/recombinase XerC [Micromonosporaceae bacterium]